MVVKLPLSWSRVMPTDWTRNLSRHLASNAGSSFIAWRRTSTVVKDSSESFSLIWIYLGLLHPRQAQCDQSLDAHSTYSYVNKVGGKDCSVSYCFGAVVLTYCERVVSICLFTRLTTTNLEGYWIAIGIL